MTDEKPKPLVCQLPKIQNRKSKIQNGISCFHWLRLQENSHLGVPMSKEKKGNKEVKKPKAESNKGKKLRKDPKRHDGLGDK
jgi:hypothetical protein